MTALDLYKRMTALDLCHSNEKPRGNVISNIKVYCFKSLFKYQSVNARGYTYLTMKCEA